MRTQKWPSKVIGEALVQAAKLYKNETSYYMSAFAFNKDTPRSLLAEYIKEPMRYGLNESKAYGTWVEKASYSTVLNSIEGMQDVLAGQLLNYLFKHNRTEFVQVYNTKASHVCRNDSFQYIKSLDTVTTTQAKMMFEAMVHKRADFFEQWSIFKHYHQHGISQSQEEWMSQCEYNSSFVQKNPTPLELAYFTKMSSELPSFYAEEALFSLFQRMIPKLMSVDSSIQQDFIHVAAAIAKPWLSDRTVMCGVASFIDRMMLVQQKTIFEHSLCSDIIKAVCIDPSKAQMTLNVLGPELLSLSALVQDQYVTCSPQNISSTLFDTGMV